ncbi:MAG: long-chain-fatty-acid--CoA ligase [Alphaproteobacteria bacterium]|nr:MAG: long-chain-fatty-acid--CoA ligase [Alphaproteobacteria bacterium]
MEEEDMRDGTAGHHHEIETAGDILTHHARLRPDQVALLFEGQAVTYGALEERVNRVAQGLIAAGVGPGDRIAHFGQNSAAYFEMLFAAARIGAVMTGLNWRLTAAELATLLSDARPPVVLFDRIFTDTVTEALAAGAPSVRLLLTSDAEDDDGGPARSFARWRDSHPARPPAYRPSPRDPLFLMYTSGTTGLPKGALISHEAVVLARRFEDEMRVHDPAFPLWDPDQVQLVQAPVFHLTGNVWALLGLYGGGRLVIHRRFDAGAVLEAIARHRITRLILVPAMLHALITHPALPETDLSSLDCIYYGGSPTPLPLLTAALRAFPCGFLQVYGMTEAGGSVSYLSPSEHDPEGRNPHMRSAGRPYPWVEICIQDQAGRPLPAGEIGEIAVRTPTVMQGYAGRPEATAAVLRDGWLLTGDAGYLDEDGFVYVVDRVRDMIISGGENIFPAEIEAEIARHPAVREVAVIGVPSSRWGEEVCAVIVPEPGRQLTAEALETFLRTRIAGYKLPRQWAFVDALPRNATGKVLRRVLKERFAQGDSGGEKEA